MAVSFNRWDFFKFSFNLRHKKLIERYTSGKLRISSTCAPREGHDIFFFLLSYRAINVKIIAR